MKHIFLTKTAKNVKNKNFENITPKKIFIVNISLNWKAPIIRHRLITRLRAVISLPFFFHLYFYLLYFFLSFSFFCLYACVLVCNCLSLCPSVYLQNQWISQSMFFFLLYVSFNLNHLMFCLCLCLSNFFSLSLVYLLPSPLSSDCRKADLMIWPWRATVWNGCVLICNTHEREKRKKKDFIDWLQDIVKIEINNISTVLFSTDMKILI